MIKKITSILLVTVMLLSVFASCQGSEPTKTLPVTKQDTSEKTENKTLPLTDNGDIITKDKTETAENSDSQKTEEITEKKVMSYKEAIDVLNTLVDYWDLGSQKEFKLVGKEIEAVIVARGKLGNQKYYRLLGDYIEKNLSKNPDYDFNDEINKINAQENRQLDIKYENGCIIAGGYICRFDDMGRIEEAVIDCNLIQGIEREAFAYNNTLKRIQLNNVCENYILDIDENIIRECYNLETMEMDFDPEDFLLNIIDSSTLSVPITVSQYLIACDLNADNRPEYKLTDSNPDNFVIRDGVLIKYLGFGGHVEIPEGVTEIRGGAFEKVSGNIMSLKLPSTLKIIRSYSFIGTNLLYEINLPENVELIEKSAIVNYSNQYRLKFNDVPKTCVIHEDAVINSHYEPNPDPIF